MYVLRMTFVCKHSRAPEPLKISLASEVTKRFVRIEIS